MIRERMILNRITQEKLVHYRQWIQNDRRNETLHSSISEKGIRGSFRGKSLEFSSMEKYEIRMKDLSVEDQNTSGRCWIYAACHMIRQLFIRKHQAKDFLFSQEYIAFYDLLEKSNYFLNFILETVQLPDDARELREKLNRPVQDAGQWDLFCNIVKKYGMLPQYAMGKNAQTKSTGEMIGFLSDILRSFACQLRRVYAETRNLRQAEQIRDTQMAHIYRFLSLSIGEPPDCFNLEICHTDGNRTEEREITPLEFYQKYLPNRLIEEAVPISCVEVAMKSGMPYVVRNLGNVAEGRRVKYLNIDLKDMKYLMLVQLKAGYPVWFGCDSRFGVDKEQGVLDVNVYDMKDLDLPFPDKNDRLRYGITCLNHAMVVEGVRMADNEKIFSWLVKNSYGELKGHQGYLDMRDQWLDQYVYEAVIFRKFLSREMTELYDNTVPLELPPWHPMGMLAD